MYIDPSNTIEPSILAIVLTKVSYLSILFSLELVMRVLVKVRVAT